MRSRDILIGVVVTVLVAAAVVLWMRAPQRQASAPAPAATPPRIALEADRPLAEGPAPSRSPVQYTLRSETEAQPGEPMTPKRAAELAERYRHMARYPRDSRLIEDGLDPIGVANAPKVERSSPRNSPDPTLITFPAVPAVEAPGTVVIYAQVVQREKNPRPKEEGDPREPRLAVRDIRGEIQNDKGAPVAAVTFRDDGTDGDAEPGDLMFTASITPDPDRPADFRGDYRVLVVARTVEGDELSATTGFSYSVPIAHLTGNYRDSIVDGSLQIEAELVVDEPGTFQLEGTLATKEAAMLGHAREVVSLQPGTSWVPLKFWGLMFREKNVDGPYTLFSLVLTTLSETPSRRGDVVPAAHTTKAYRAAEFSDTPYDDPEMLQKAAEMEALARRGQ